MESVRIIFARSNTAASALIRLFTWSRWSHCGIIDGDKVIEATALHGVVATPLDEFMRRYSTWSVAVMPVDNATAAIGRARAEIGKPYDWSGIFGIALRTGWSSDDKWFCSELIAYASQLFRSDRVSRIRPENIWQVSK